MIRTIISIQKKEWRLKWNAQNYRVEKWMGPLNGPDQPSWMYGTGQMFLRVRMYEAREEFNSRIECMGIVSEVLNVWFCCGLLCYANQLSPASGYSQPWWVARVVECGNPGGDRGSSAGGDTGTQGGWQGDTGRSISGHHHHRQVWDTDTRTGAKLAGGNLKEQS